MIDVMRMNPARSVAPATPIGLAQELALLQPFELLEFMKCVAPDRGKYETREIKCAHFLDVEQLSTAQRADLAVGTATVEAVWKAVQADPFWSRDNEWPMRRCVLTALIVRDTLHAVGRRDATVTPMGQRLVQMSGDKMLHNFTIGRPGVKSRGNAWNAHMVVGLGDIVFDPTCGQTQRFWNAAPDAAALLVERKRGHKVGLGKWGKANVMAQHCYRHAEFEYCVSYFELTRSVAQNARNWVNAGDARPERRRSLVQSAARLLQPVNPPSGHDLDQGEPVRDASAPAAWRR